MLTAVIFDIDGVLVDSKNANVALYQTIITNAGYEKPTREAVLACFHMPLWQSLEKLTGVSDAEELDRMFKMARDPAIRDEDLFEFPPELVATLERLHSQYKLAIVTGRIRYGVDAIFSAVPISSLFDVVVAFEDYDKPKPDPEPLLVALKQLGVSADEAVYIGDSDTDIDAARDAGMRSVHLSVAPHKDATAVIDEFEELLAAIESIAKL